MRNLFLLVCFACPVVLVAGPDGSAVSAGAGVGANLGRPARATGVSADAPTQPAESVEDLVELAPHRSGFPAYLPARPPVPQPSAEAKAVRYPVELARVHLKYGEFANAAELLTVAEAAAEDDQQRLAVYSAQAELARRSGDGEALAGLLDKQLDLAPNGTEVAPLLAELIALLVKRRAYGDAEPHCRQLLANPLPGWQEQGARWLAAIHRAQGTLQQYVAALEKETQDSPKEPTTLQALVEAYSQSPRNAAVRRKAIAVLQELALAQPENQEYRLRLAVALAEAGEHLRAVDVLEQERQRRASKDEFLIRRILELYVDSGNKVQALEWMNRLQARGDLTGDELLEQATALQHFGLLPEARERLDTVLAEAGGNSERRIDITLRLIDLDRSAKRYAEAEQKLRGLLKQELDDQTKNTLKRRLFQLLDETGRLSEVELPPRQESRRPAERK